MLKELVDKLCDHFGIDCTKSDREEIVRRIVFHSRFLNSSDSHEIVSLIFIECAEHGRPVTLGDLFKIISKSQKKILRQLKSPSPGQREKLLERLQQAKDNAKDNSNKQSELDLNLLDIVNYLKAKLTTRQFLVFQLRFIDDMKPTDIVETLGVSKSVVYREIESTRECLKGYLSSIAGTQKSDDGC